MQWAGYVLGYWESGGFVYSSLLLEESKSSPGEMQGSVRRWAGEFLVYLLASSERFGAGTGWAEPSLGSAGALREPGWAAGSRWWWGAVAPGRWAALREEHGSSLKAQKSLGLQRWGEDDYLSGAAVQLASPRRAHRGCTLLLLPGVNGVFRFVFSFSEADPRWELRLCCRGKYSIPLLLFSARILPLEPCHAWVGCPLALVFLG